MEPSTKDRITEAALRLFSEKGYLGTSLGDIAKQVGVSKAALYKHFACKQDILDCIVARMDELDAERSQRFSMPGNEPGGTAAYKEIPAEKIRAYSKAQFLHWTEEEFPSRFRKMLTLEQYRDSGMAELYQKYLAGGPVEYMASVFGEITGSEDAAWQLALEFYGPMFLLYGLSDGGMSEARATELLDDHVSRFIDQMEAGRICCAAGKEDSR
jgi:AcrR family transcriptional regulator